MGPDLSAIGLPDGCAGFALAGAYRLGDGGMVPPRPGFIDGPGDSYEVEHEGFADERRTGCPSGGAGNPLAGPRRPVRAGHGGWPRAPASPA